MSTSDKVTRTWQSIYIRRDCCLCGCSLHLQIGLLEQARKPIRLPLPETGDVCGDSATFFDAEERSWRGGVACALIAGLDSAKTYSPLAVDSILEELSLHLTLMVSDTSFRLKGGMIMSAFLVLHSH